MCTKLTYILVSVLAAAAGAPVPGPTDTVDQSQYGELNVQVSLKNVEIIAMLDGGREQYSDYDYNYDYAQMTVKPSANTTETPLNVTAALNSSGSASQATATTENIVDITPPKKDPTEDHGFSSSTPAAVTPESDALSEHPAVTLSRASTIASAVSDTTAGNETERPTAILAPSSVVAEAVSEATEKDCRKGFHRNKKGECEFKLKPSSTNALLKLVELSQKLKLRRVN